MVKLLNRYKIFLGLATINALLYLSSSGAGARSLEIELDNLETIAVVLPPIFILLWLLDIWIPKKTVTKWLGNRSGVVGISLAFLLGSASAGPL